MKVCIDIVDGNGRDPGKSDMDLLIKAVDRAIAREYNMAEVTKLVDARTILKGIKKRLPDRPDDSPCAW